MSCAPNIEPAFRLGGKPRMPGNGWHARARRKIYHLALIHCAACGGKLENARVVFGARGECISGVLLAGKPAKGGKNVAPTNLYSPASFA